MNIPCDPMRNRHTKKNLQRPYSSLNLIKAYISLIMKNKETAPDTPRKAHFKVSKGTTLRAVVMMKIVKE